MGLAMSIWAPTGRDTNCDPQDTTGTTKYKTLPHLDRWKLGRIGVHIFVCFMHWKSGGLQLYWPHAADVKRYLQTNRVSRSPGCYAFLIKSSFISQPRWTCADFRRDFRKATTQLKIWRNHLSISKRYNQFIDAHKESIDSLTRPVNCLEEDWTLKTQVCCIL